MNNNYLLQPPLDVPVKPHKLCSPLKRAGINSLTHKSPTSSMLTLPEELRFTPEPQSMGFASSYKHENEILPTSSSTFRQEVDCFVASPYFFQRHENKSEVKFNKRLEIPYHLTPVPSAPDFTSRTPDSSRFMFNCVGSQPETLKSGFLPRLESRFNGRKTVVIDLDETLVYASGNNKTPDHIISKVLQDGTNLCLKVSVRPYAREFLRNVAGLADVVIFTASVKSYADLVIDLLDTEKEFVKMRLYRDSCVLTRHGYVKDLTVLRKPLKDVVIIDNLESSFAKQKENGILVSSWYGDKGDGELFKLWKNMRKILMCEDVRKCDKFY